MADEKERWEAGSETFKSQMSTISGDVMLTSAFMAYAGYFDQHFRQNLFTSWASHMQQANIAFRPDLARVEVSDVTYSLHFHYKIIMGITLSLRSAISMVNYTVSYSSYIEYIVRHLLKE